MYENDFIPGSGHGGADEDPTRPVGRAEVLVMDELPRAVHHHARSLWSVAELQNLSGPFSSVIVKYLLIHVDINPTLCVSTEMLVTPSTLKSNGCNL